MMQQQIQEFAAAHPLAVLLAFIVLQAVAIIAVVGLFVRGQRR